MTNNKDLKKLLDLVMGPVWAEAWEKDPQGMMNKLYLHKQNEFYIINKFMKFDNESVVLDYGIGMGIIAEHVCKVASRVYGWDTDSATLDHCIKKNLKNLELLPPYCQVDDLKSLGINTIMANNVIGEYYSIDDFGNLLSSFSEILPVGSKVWFDWYNRSKTKSSFDENDAALFVSDKMNFYTFDQVRTTIEKSGNFSVVFIDDRYQHAKALIKSI